MFFFCLSWKKVHTGIVVAAVICKKFALPRRLSDGIPQGAAREAVSWRRIPQLRHQNSPCVCASIARREGTYLTKPGRSTALRRSPGSQSNVRSKLILSALTVCGTADLDEIVN